ASDQINWSAQDNWLFLEDYYQDLDRLQVAPTDIYVLSQMVREQPGILLSDLQQAAKDLPTDVLNIAIPTNDLYVDLPTYRLSEPWRIPVFPDRSSARATGHPPDQIENQVTSSITLTALAGTIVSWAGKQWQISEATVTSIILACEGSEPFPLARSAFDALL